MVKLDSLFKTMKNENNYPSVRDNLLKKFGYESMAPLRKEFLDENGWQNKDGLYIGTLKNKFKELDEVELAIILHCGFAFFGGHSNIDPKTNKFEVELWDN